MAQPGSALAWGARGRKFESCRPDQLLTRGEGKDVGPDFGPSTIESGGADPLAEARVSRLHRRRCCRAWATGRNRESVHCLSAVPVHSTCRSSGIQPIHLKASAFSDGAPSEAELSPFFILSVRSSNNNGPEMWREILSTIYGFRGFTKGLTSLKALPRCDCSAEICSVFASTSSPKTNRRTSRKVRMCRHRQP